MSKKQSKFDHKRWISCPIEEEYFGDERKLSKQERKMASAKDRSKYKKTDWHKHEKSREDLQAAKLKEDLDRGLVISIMSQGILVNSGGKDYTCFLRGVLKKEKGLAKNLVAVGDFVLFEKTADNEGSILHVEPRKTVLSRADNLSRRKEQVIAANIDQVLITSSVVDPPLKPYLIDRYIIAAQKGGMAPVIIVNKIDLLQQDSFLAAVDKEVYEELLSAYKKAGIKVISLSATDLNGVEELKAAMKDKISVFSGQSGVGKTSLINVITGLDLRTGKTVEKTKKGAHTTTSAQLMPLEFGGWCIDTPGIKSFGIWDLKKEEIEGYFEEINEAGRKCKFPDCSHTHEKECGVLKDVEEGKISQLRYDSYVALMDSVTKEHLRR